jgi:two-component system sensor histidine kinase KdpD
LSTATAAPREHDVRDRTLQVGGIALALVAATVTAAIVEAVGVADASPVYLVAVVVAAATSGMWAAVGTSFIAFLVYDFLFTSPRFSFAVSDPAEWVSLLLFLIVAVVIGRLASLQRERAEEADRRSRESVALVAISREISMATTFDDAAAMVATRLRVDAEMSVVWITVAGGESGETLIAATDDPPSAADQGVPWRLMRADADGPSDWLRVMDAAPAPTTGDPALVAYVIPIEGDTEPAGWIHAVRSRDEPRPGRGARRILTLAADQLAFALRREELQADLNAAEVARHGDALRAAILDSVSHELRTPIASIRAIAGGLLDPAADPTKADVIQAATSIDAEGARLADLVGSLLDMGRIQAGELRPDLEPHELSAIVETALRRSVPSSPGRRLVVDIPDALPLVLVDARLFDVALGNVVDNAIRHTPGSTRIGIGASRDGDGLVLAVDDDGPGVPAAAMEHLFDRFYRVPPAADDGRQARQGLGMGLAIARGFLEAMGGSIEAAPSSSGGLCIRIRLRTVDEGSRTDAG